MTLEVLIIDDHPLFREALSLAVRKIAPDAQIWEATSAEDGLRMAQENGEPDLVLLDVNLPGMDGVAATKVFNGKYPSLPVVVVSGTEDPKMQRAALRAGAAGMISKISPAREMDAAIRAVLAGNTWRPPQFASQSADMPAAGFSNPQTGDDGSEDGTEQDYALLTVRQLEVLHLIAQGMSNKGIARQLDLTEKTVKSHITRIFKFLGVANRTQAVIAAQGIGLVKRSLSGAA